MLPRRLEATTVPILNQVKELFIVEFTTPVVFEDKLHFAVRECAELYELNDASGHLTLAQSLQVLHYVVSLQPH